MKRFFLSQIEIEFNTIHSEYKTPVFYVDLVSVPCHLTFNRKYWYG